MSEPGRRLDGRVVIVTGAASGIGRATAVRAAEEGARVVAVDIDEPGLVEAAAQMRESGTDPLTVRADVSSEDDVAGVVRRAAEELGGVHGVVTCAGVFDLEELTAAADVTVESFNRVLAVNVLGTFLPVKHALPHLVATRGAVVTIGSIAAILGNGWAAAYTASKGAVVSLTRLIAAQYARAGVRANCVCPGGVDTPMSRAIYPDPDVAERVVDVVPLRRAAQPGEVAAAIAFLLSDDASFMTGSTVVVDGGLTIV